MANEEHLDILKRSITEWNVWRGENPEIRPELSGAKFIDTDLSEVNFSYANLNDAILTGAKFSGANFDDASLMYANLTGVDLSNAALDDTNFSYATLRNANLKWSSLVRTNFNGADLNGADLSNAYVGAATFCANDLSVVIGLEDVEFLGPSTIGTDTLFQSQGKIPESFLRGCGVPDIIITFAKSLVGKAIDYYSAFISYSSKNTDIAERLYADLQSKGVRCWFAPEDIKIGDKFRQRIDEAIRIHDKLLVVLSEDSINSAWVEDEVEAALERERRENRLVMFPIRIDDAVINSSQAWAASLRRVRHIGDFSKWKDHDSYSKAFERLLRDLKAVDK